MKKIKRSYELELIDLGSSHYTQEEYEDCLHQLSRIGHFLGGNRATFKALDRHLKIESILDLGCGGGQFALELGKRYPKIKVVGVDIASDAIEYANKQLKKTALKNVSFNQMSSSSSCLSNAFDVVTTTLVCHHLNDEELIDFLKNAYQTAKKAVIINDLHRHWLAFSSFALISKIFFRNRLIHHDGLLSIKRAFTKQDWIHYLKAACIPLEHCRISWYFAFRWVVHIDASKKEI
ncbi:MAG TPA: methyltransferase domain-containing protein [Parachlamydiaceae bacterium]|nr:methyltransferase domain-containing protein [Parachlamydiaceae bacterium]